jgi:hypothetical protein
MATALRCLQWRRFVRRVESMADDLIYSNYMTTLLYRRTILVRG